MHVKILTRPACLAKDNYTYVTFAGGDKKRRRSQSNYDAWGIKFRILGKNWSVFELQKFYYMENSSEFNQESNVTIRFSLTIA